MDARRSVALGGAVVAVGGADTAAAASPAPAPALTSAVTGVQRFEGRLVALEGERLRVTARVRGATPGSVLVVRAGDGAPRVHRLRPGANLVRDAFPAGGPGVTTVRVSLHGGYAELQARRPPVRVTVLRPAARRGDRGPRVRFLQRRLAALRYAIRPTGRYDDHTANAVIAFRKVNRMRRVSNASPQVFRRVARGQGAFRPRRRGPAHVEGDLTRQVLALVGRGGRVHRVYMTSSGRPGLRTPAGVHRFYRKAAGWNSSGMLDSAYFTHPSGPRTACAIHGYFVVPAWNASHCCLRVPIADARTIFRWVRIGQRIHVYY